VLIMQVLQKLAGSQLFDMNDEYMKLMNPFLREHAAPMLGFLKDITVRYLRTTTNNTTDNINHHHNNKQLQQHHRPPPPTTYHHHHPPTTTTTTLHHSRLLNSRCYRLGSPRLMPMISTFPPASQQPSKQPSHERLWDNFFINSTSTVKGFH